MALGQVFCESFGFPCQLSFHRLLHTHLLSGAGTTGPIVAGVPSGLKSHPTARIKEVKMVKKIFEMKPEGGRKVRMPIGRWLEDEEMIVESH
jgi:hypothetical protein